MIEEWEEAERREAESNTPLARAAAEHAKWAARYRVLGECAVMVEAQKRRFSRNEASQTAKPGYEAAFEQEEANLEVLREMMRECRAESDRALRAIGEARFGGT